MQELEGQSKRIQQVYTETTVDVAQPLEAITIYNRLIELMNLAQNSSYDAQQTTKAAENILKTTVILKLTLFNLHYCLERGSQN